MEREKARKIYAGVPCVYCGAEPSTLDHVVPKSRGGSGRACNLVPACRRCQDLKGALLPHDFFPRYPKMAAHFVRCAKWVKDSLRELAQQAVMASEER